jgi:hypothetical protein
MTMSKWDKLAALGVLALLPALLVGGGFIIAILLAVGWAAAVYGAKYGLDIKREREMGRHGKKGVTDMIQGKQSRRKRK